MALLTEISHLADAMRHHYTRCQVLERQRQQQRLPTTNCDQFQPIGGTVGTNCCRASGRLWPAGHCVNAGLADDLAESTSPTGGSVEQNAAGGTIGQRRRPCARHQSDSNTRTTMIIDNLANHVAKRCNSRPLSLALMSCALLLLVAMATPAPAPFLNPFESMSIDSSCNGQGAQFVRSNAYQLLLVLRCDIAPLYDRYVATYYRNESSEVLQRHPVAGGEFGAFRRKIEQFFEAAENVLRLREFCTWSTFSKLSAMRDLVKDSQLLTLAYDLVAIELHTTCVGQAISKLPPVPHLVKDIVKIYIDGADKPLPDLNSPALNDDMEDDMPFDEEAAVRQNGSLEDVVGLSLTMFGRAMSNQETAQEFRATCKNFLIAIGQCWDTMEIMNSLVATDGSAIRQVNNYALRTLAPTKFADICSKISALA